MSDEGEINSFCRCSDPEQLRELYAHRELWPIDILINNAVDIW